jgi:hypothetical protein
MHTLIKRGLIAAAVLASVSTPAAFLASQAGATQTKGAEALNVTIYEVGRPASSIGGGPASAGGVVAAKGNVADTASLPTDPAHSTRSVFAFPAGTFTFLVSGGQYKVASLNNVTCRFIANLSNAQGSIVSGTGQFASATGTFRVSASITGNLKHKSGGGCNENANPILDVVQGHATGNINLH